MGLNPIPYALVCTLAYTIQILAAGSGVVEVNFPDPDIDFGGGFFGFLSGLFDLAKAGVELAVFIFQFLTFQISGVPWYIGVPIAVFCNGSIIWSIVLVFRGTS